MINKKIILCLSPHCDDLEFACGGTISKLVEQGNDVHIMTFSFCQESIPENFEKDILKQEMPLALSQLGIIKSNITSLDFPVRNFPKYRQDILEELVKINKQINPDLIFSPNSKDIHQDHSVIHTESLRAFKKKSILGYEMIWNNFNTVNNFYIKLEERHINAKINSIMEYKSQFFRGLSDSNIFLSLAKVRGAEIYSDYAEAFEVMRWID